MVQWLCFTFVKNIVAPDKKDVPPAFMDEKIEKKKSTPSLKKENQTSTELGFQPI
jgi:hypothetical protein